jgi:hypothetical protein
MTARDSGGAGWRKSSYSGESGCVEVAPAQGGVVVRDSKNPDGPTLTVGTAVWQDYLAAITHLPVG